MCNIQKTTHIYMVISYHIISCWKFLLVLNVPKCVRCQDPLLHKQAAAAAACAHFIWLKLKYFIYKSSISDAALLHLEKCEHIFKN